MAKRKIYEEKMKEKDEKRKKEEELVQIEEKKKEKIYQQHVSKTKNIAHVYKNQKETEEKKVALLNKVFSWLLLLFCNILK